MRGSEKPSCEITDRYAIDNLVNNVGLTAERRNRGHYARALSRRDGGERRLGDCLPPRPYWRPCALARMGECQHGQPGHARAHRAHGLLAAKAGVVGLTRTLALELAETASPSIGISPGPSRQRFKRLNPRVGNEPTALEKAVPIGRLGEPREIAGAVAYFLSEDAAFTTGQVLHVCGGLSVGFAPI